MEQGIRSALHGGVALALAASLLSACTSTPKPAVTAPSAQGAASQAVSSAVPGAAATVAPTTPPGSAENERPGAVEGELVVIEAKVKAVDAKHRVVTLKFADGSTNEIKCGPEVRNFPQIRVGDDVRLEFLETVELFVTPPQGKPKADAVDVVERAPAGGKPGIVEVDTVEVSANVESIDYASRVVKLRGPEGKLFTLKAGPEIERLDEVKKGDTVVARLTEAVSVRVTSPR